MTVVADVRPEADRIDFLLSHLCDPTSDEIARFYLSATDDKRLMMAAAATSVGRIPPDWNLAPTLNLCERPV
jgi:hypothetical protein